MSDRRPAAEAEALELLLLADIQASADQLSDIVDNRIATLRRCAYDLYCALPPGMGRDPDFLPTGQQHRTLDTAEDADAQADRLARWYGALLAVSGACDDVLTDRVPA